MHVSVIYVCRVFSVLCSVLCDRLIVYFIIIFIRCDRFITMLVLVWVRWLEFPDMFDKPVEMSSNDTIHGVVKHLKMLPDGNNIFMEGLPPVVPCGLTSSSYPHSDQSSAKLSHSDHSSAKLFEKKFCFKKKEDAKRPSIIWMRHNRLAEDDELLDWNAEQSLCAHVADVLSDIFTGSELKGIRFKQEMSLFDAMKADIWIVTNFGVPIGVVEVKRYDISSKSNPLSVVSDEHNLGQLYDYLLHLKAYGGRQYVFGLLTTYDNWLIAWLPDTDEIAELAEIPNGSHPSQITKPISDSMPFPDKDKSISFSSDMAVLATEEMETRVEYDRVLHGSKVFHWNDPDLPHAILSVGRKMMSSPVSPRLCKFEKEVSYIYLTEQSWSWRRVREVKELKIQCKVPSHLQNVYLLADLGGGGDGRVWLATTKNGEVCVLKFCNDSKKLEQERELWAKAWNIKVSTKRLNQRDVLIMPWVKPCTEEELKMADIQEAIKKAITRLADVGYKHDDLDRRHVGLYRNDSSIAAVLFDFARVRPVKDPKEKEIAITEMLKELQI